MFTWFFSIEYLVYLEKKDTITINIIWASGHTLFRTTFSPHEEDKQLQWNCPWTRMMASKKTQWYLVDYKLYHPLMLEVSSIVRDVQEWLTNIGRSSDVFAIYLNSSISLTSIFVRSYSHRFDQVKLEVHVHKSSIGYKSYITHYC